MKIKSKFKFYLFSAILALLIYDICMNLKELRIKKGLSQSKASALASIPLRTYKRIENDKNYVNTHKYIYAFKRISDYNPKVHKEVPSYKVVIVGAGYVGFSIAVLLASHHQVTVVDINQEKIDKINRREPIFLDKDIEHYLKTKKLNLRATPIDLSVYKDSDFVIISTPTDYDEENKTFNMSNVINTVNDIRKINSEVLIVIKSTSYIGFTESLHDKNIIFSPEFLREGKALSDNLSPSRIIIGGEENNKMVKEFARMMEAETLNNPTVLFMSRSEAEATKLFSNAYLALRVAYFNEMDSLLNKYSLRSDLVTSGVSLDPRIGDYYNNPSFGYGGYCLPKDTDALISQMGDVSNNELITSISKSNKSRKKYIAEDILRRIKPGDVVGVYSLQSKSSSDNTRFASIKDVIEELKERGVNILIFDKQKMTLEEFKNVSDLIIANRYDPLLDDVAHKVYTRDIYKRD